VNPDHPLLHGCQHIVIPVLLGFKGNGFVSLKRFQFLGSVTFISKVRISFIFARVPDIVYRTLGLYQKVSGVE